MKKGILAIAAAVCLLAGATTAAASGAGATSLGIEEGDIVISESGSYSVSGYTGPNTITVKSGAAADLTISGLYITAEGAPAIRVEAGASLNLTVEGENSLTGGPGFAGICVEPGWDQSSSFSPEASGRLVIQGTGSLSAQGGGAAPEDGVGGGAGIGGNGFGTGNFDGGDFGVVEILSGTVSASGGGASDLNHGAGAGIGGGGGDDCGAGSSTTVIWIYSGRISIRGGNVTARGGADYSDFCAGAGIGSGSSDASHGTTSDDLQISITGGVVEAYGGTDAAGIGGGVNGACGTLAITGGDVRAYGGKENDSSAFGGAGIGGGDSAGGRSITIGGTAEVFAQGGGAAAGIGGGNGGYVGEIVINGSANVTAVGGNPTGRNVDEAGMRAGAGIGGGNNNNFATGEQSTHLTLDSAGTVIAYGGMGAQAIGMGTGPHDDKSFAVEVGNNAGVVWMFNYDQGQSAVYGVIEDNTLNFDWLSVPYHTIFWHNGSGETVGGAAYACKENGSVDGGTYSWSVENHTVSIEQGAAEILSGAFDPVLHDAYDNWAVIYRAPEPEPVTVSLADLIIYVGGSGYESVVTTEDGETVVKVSDGLPEPGFTIELPEAVDSALRRAAGYVGDGPLDLSHYLSFSYDDGEGTTRSWTLERYDGKEGNSSMSGGRYIYRIVPAEDQGKVRLQFTGEDGQTSTSDDFEIVLSDQYQVFDMAIYPGALKSEHLQAVVTFPDGSAQSFDMDSEPAELTIRGVVDDADGKDPVTDIITSEPSSEAADITARVPAGTLFYINDSGLEVEHWDAVKLLADKIIPAAEDILLGRTYEDFPQITEEYSYEYRYLDLVDTSNGNVWVTASEDITIYWPYPKGTDERDEFYIVHYKGLNRQYDGDLEGMDYDTELFSTENGKLEKTEYGLKITVDSFSPFALFWQESGGGHWPPVIIPTPTPDVTPTPTVSPDAPPAGGGDSGGADEQPEESGRPEESPKPSEPVQPSAPAETPAPTSPGDPDDVPATGDTTHLTLWLALAAISLLGALCSLLGLRRLERGRRR